jgi:hypothetical protein
MKQSTKAERREYDLVRRYGITQAEYDGFFVLQNGLCAICGHPETHKKYTPKLSIDHNHDTGKVRALLCHRCNALIGYSGNSIKTLQCAIKYLETYS